MTTAAGLVPGRFFFVQEPGGFARCERGRRSGTVERVRHLLSIALAAVACTSSPAQPGSGAPEPAASSPPPASSSPPDPCRQAIADYERVLAEAPPKCGHDGDCACYPGGVSDQKGCGGVDHRSKASRLAAARDRYTGAGCRSTIHCAGWSCQPVCNNGSCVNGP